MSQRIPEQPNIGKCKAVAVYPTQQNAEIAMRELEKFERTVLQGQRLSNQGARGTSTASDGEY